MEATASMLVCGRMRQGDWRPFLLSAFGLQMRKRLGIRKLYSLRISPSDQHMPSRHQVEALWPHTGPRK
jgi:hypothetical protein